MRFFKPYLRAVLILASAVCLWNCSEQELPDNREHDYGYVQFKVYKQASYSPVSKAEKDELDYLSEACKINVSMVYNSRTISQTMVLSASDEESAEYGLRSDKLQLLGGEYEIVNFTLYDALDEVLYRGSISDDSQRYFTVTPGGLESHDLTVNVTPRGHVRFTLVKDKSDFEGLDTKAVTREYLFEEIKYFSVELEDRNDQGHKETFEMLPVEFSIHFEDNGDDADGYQTSSLACDSLLSVPAGDYRVISYTTYDSEELPLEVSEASWLKVSEFSVADNSLTDADVKITLHKTDSYLRDNYILKKIWEALGGPDWSYNGQTGVKPASVAPGDMRSGIVSLPPEIGRLTRLEKLNIANCPIYTLGETDEPVEGYTPGIAGLKNLTDLEIYNCPYLDQFPDIAGLSKLISANLTYIVSDSHPYLDELNSLPSLPEGKEITPITGEDVKNGLAAMSRGAVSRTLQELYCIGNCMEEFPSEMKDFADLAMMDFSDNRIETLPRMGKDFDPSELHLENNAITGFTGEGDFCDPDLLTSISLANNKLTEFPDIFRPGAELKIGTIDLSNNQIQGFPDMTALAEDEDFLYVETLNLGGNRIETFPEGFFDHCEADYIIMSNCGMKTVPEGAFDGKYSESLVSLDLQYNRLKDIPDDLNATSAPYLYGVDISYNAFTSIPDGILSCKGLTILGMKGQRTDAGERCFRTWPATIYQHTGLRAFYAGSNDIRTVPAEQVSTSIFYLEIAGNPNITFDASGICDLWRSGMFFLYYDRSQNITNCEAMLQ